MNWKNILTGLVIAYILLVTYMTIQILLLEVRTVPMDVEVTQIVGINLDTDALHFGGVRGGGAAHRSIIVSNNDVKAKHVKVNMHGELGRWAWVKEPFFQLSAGEQRNMTVYIQIPPEAEERAYNGTVRLVFFR